MFMYAVAVSPSGKPLSVASAGAINFPDQMKSLEGAVVPLGVSQTTASRTAHGTVKVRSLRRQPWAHAFTEEDGELRRTESHRGRKPARSQRTRLAPIAPRRSVRLCRTTAEERATAERACDSAGLSRLPAGWQSTRRCRSAALEKR